MKLVVVVVLVAAVALGAYTWVDRIYQDGAAALKNGDADASVALLERAAGLRSRKARVLLAEMHALGLAVERDRDAALAYYEAVDKRQMILSVLSVAHALREGHHGPADEEEARYWESRVLSEAK